MIRDDLCDSSFLFEIFFNQCFSSFTPNQDHPSIHKVSQFFFVTADRIKANEVSIQSFRISLASVELLGTHTVIG